MVAQSLQDLIDGTDDLVGHFRASKVGKHVYPVVPAEFTNWQAEQRAWRTGVAFFDQSHHMVNYFIKGKDAVRLVSETGIGSVADFDVNRAKQFTATGHDGNVLGDGILFREAEDEFIFVGRIPTAHWLDFQVETGGYDVETRTDNRSPSRPTGPVTRELFRFEVQGPLAWQLLEKVNGGPIEQAKFFRMGWMTIDGIRVRTLRHGVAGQPGLELWGPYDLYDRIRDAILAAGEEFGILSVGSRAYPSVSGEVGWIPSPVPPIYTSEAMADYRKWLPADGFEAVGSITGSFESDRIEDYYLRPWDLGYGKLIKFDHDFVGREALEAVDPATQRRKLTLEWNADDIARVYRSLFSPDGPVYKFFDLPNATYGTANFDSVTKDGRLVGLSTYTSYSYNERRALSLAALDPGVEIGDEVELVWGEPNGGEGLVVLEPHEQTTIRATVRPAPYSADTRSGYEGARWNKN
ncbi:vanillate/3-O-methylgallate O-demethylase [Naasia aerilata]|uniref:Glycine cleavage system protein T n=1 Tax=Naasia aerilata TaxID=1162966 RepID=A0ABN6XMS3_9MICO|nr:aminomethyl transferase family protein [Naasia aerilata]BDZ46209.1 glycine cleavage system protein T [Naasia aerilata]